MKFAKFLLIALVAGACIVQANAGLGKLFDKVKDKVTGDDDKKQESAEKPELKRDDSGVGVVKRVAHKVVEAASNQLESEAKNKIGNPLAKPVIAFVADKFEDKVHDAIDKIGATSPAPPKPVEEPPKPAEELPKLDGEPEKKGVIGGLMDKLTRRKRSTNEDGVHKKGIISRAITKVKSLISGRKPAPTSNQGTVPTPQPVGAATNTETRVEPKKSDSDAPRVESEDRPRVESEDKPRVELKETLSKHDNDDEEKREAREEHHNNRRTSEVDDEDEDEEEEEARDETKRRAKDNEIESEDSREAGVKTAHHDDKDDNDNKVGHADDNGDDDDYEGDTEDNEQVEHQGDTKRKMKKEHKDESNDEEDDEHQQRGSRRLHRSDDN